MPEYREQAEAGVQVVFGSQSPTLWLSPRPHLPTHAGSGAGRKAREPQEGVGPRSLGCPGCWLLALVGGFNEETCGIKQV